METSPRKARSASPAALLPAVAAGVIAVLLSFSGPLVIFYQAAQAAHIDSAGFASWVLGISVGAGAVGVLLSWRLKVPVITAWSAPGTALLITLFPELSLGEAVGAYITAALILLALGLIGNFDSLIARIPKGVASGMMAGILLPFGLDAFRSVTSFPLLAGAMIVCYLVFKRCTPRYSIALLLAAGVLMALAGGRADFSAVRFELATPHWITPHWTWTSTFSLALPLVLVTLTGQYLPGLAVLRDAGYQVPARPVLVASSVASLLVATAGGITIGLAAITAAICTSSDAHPDPGRRYIAGIANGLTLLIAGLFAGTIVAVFAALPRELIATLAGLALLGPITASLNGMLAAETEREAAVITFLATASGMRFLGLGAALWGIVIGLLAWRVLYGRALPWRAKPIASPQ